MANKCTICDKTVYLTEKREACKKIYHIDCFRCGGKNDDGCKKKLTLDSYSVHSDEPYCKPCYTRQFGPKGVRASLGGGIAVASSTDVQDEPEIDSEAGGGVKAALNKLKDHLSDADKLKLSSP